MKPIARETYVERRQSYFRWSAVIAGVSVALATWLTLQLIGAGIGFAGVEVDDAGSLKNAGIGAGIWSVIVPLIALLVGGFVAARLAGTWSRRIGMMHAAVLWSITVLLGASVLFAALGAIVGTTMRAADVAARHGGDALEAVGIDADALVGPVNERLRASGKPEVTAGQLEDTVRAITRRGLREGRFDRDMAAQELARNTALDRADADAVATDLEQQWDEQAGALGDRAEHAALSAADTVGKTMLGAGLALLLGLGAALGGGALGAVARRSADNENR